MTSPSYSSTRPNSPAKSGEAYQQSLARDNPPTYHRRIASSLGALTSTEPVQRSTLFQTPNKLCAGQRRRWNGGMPEKAKVRIVSPQEIALMLGGHALSCVGLHYWCERLTKSGLRWRCGTRLLSMSYAKPQRCRECREGKIG